MRLKVNRNPKKNPPMPVQVWLYAHNLQEISQAAYEDGLEPEFIIAALAAEAASKGKEYIKRKIKRMRWSSKFTAGKISWDIDKARRLVIDREPNYTYKLNRKSMAYINVCHVDERYAMSRDLSIPLILVPCRKSKLTPESVRPIDGHHRIFKGFLTGKKSLPGYLLTKEEAAQIVIDRPKE